MHNELLGRPTAIQLFSDLLPFRRWSLAWLAEQKTVAEPDALLDTLETWTAEASTDALQAWCRSTDRPRGKPLGEGLHLGRITATELADPSTLQEIARHLAGSYLDQGPHLRPPYFDLAR